MVYDNEGLGESPLWERVQELCPAIFKSITDERVTLESICGRTLEQQGLEIDSLKLHGRAYNTAYNFEFNDMLEPVEAAYKEIIKESAA